MQAPTLSMLGVLLPLAHRVHLSLGDLVHVCDGYLILFPFVSFTFTPNSKEILGVIGIGLTWRAPSSCVEPICASSSCSISLIMELSVFLIRQSYGQCGPSHRKHLILGGNSFIFALPFHLWTLGVLPDLILAVLWSLKTSSLPTLAWLSF